LALRKAHKSTPQKMGKEDSKVFGTFVPFKIQNVK
jgi:hypothetical protein